MHAVEISEIVACKLWLHPHIHKLIAGLDTIALLRPFCFHCFLFGFANLVIFFKNQRERTFPSPLSNLLLRIFHCARGLFSRFSDNSLAGYHALFVRVGFPGADICILQGCNHASHLFRGEYFINCRQASEVEVLALRATGQRCLVERHADDCFLSIHYFLPPFC